MDAQKTDILIIGSGMSALTSAILLLRKGYSVRILEAHYKAGGYMHSFEKMGHTYDSGAHYVGALAPHEPFWALLNYLEVYDEGLFTPLDEEAFDSFYFKNQKVKEIHYGKGYERVIEHFSESFPEERAGIKTFFETIQNTARNFPTYHFLVNYDQSKLLKSLETSLLTEAKKHTQNAELLNAFFGYCGLHGVMPADVSFGLHSIIVDSLIRSGGYGFRGSGDALVKKLVKKIESLGGEILLKQKVTSFEIKDKKVQSLITRKGTVFEADHFIFSGHPKDMIEIAGAEHFRKLYTKRIDKTPDSIGIMGIYGVAKPGTFSNIKRNYYQVTTPLPEHFDPYEKRPLSKDPIISFVTFPDRELNPKIDEIPFSIHAPQLYSWVEDWKSQRAYSRNKDYLNFKEKLTDSIFDFVETSGLKIKENTLKFESSTSLTNRRFNLSPQGSAYGIYHSMDYTGVRALSGKTSIENLFITGQNTLFPGIMAASIAGIRTTGFLIGIKETIAGIRKVMDGQ
jgi:all-trans-retinol 13,14-reductase